MGWKPLVRTTPYAHGVPIDIGDEEQWANDEYIVNKREHEPLDENTPRMIHLSIRNADRTSVKHDWRDFQRIKNQLAGPEWEGVEIYPAESRKVDGANQFHLWCFETILPIGFHHRLVTNPAQTEILTPGAAQRPFEAVDLEHGGLTKLKEARALIDPEYGRPLE